MKPRTRLKSHLGEHCDVDIYGSEFGNSYVVEVRRPTGGLIAKRRFRTTTAQWMCRKRAEAWAKLMFLAHNVPLAPTSTPES